MHHSVYTIFVHLYIVCIYFPVLSYPLKHVICSKRYSACLMQIQLHLNPSSSPNPHGLVPGGLVCDGPFCEVISVSLHMSVITQGGYSALMIAARRGEREIVSLLLEAGANIHLQSKV